MTQPQIIIEDWQGRHNIGESAKRIEAQGLFKDCSTVCVIPSPNGLIPARVVQNWMGMIVPMNQKFTRMFMIGMEVGVAYQTAIETILANPELSKWKFVLTLEHDNLLPPDALIKLLEAAYKHPEYDVIGGLYWTKGEGGQPMCYGDPNVHPRNCIPQIPPDNEIKEFNGLGMGFNLFRLDIFRDERIQKPWFKTQQEYTPGQGIGCFTQDLYFYTNAGKYGHRFACDGRVKVGHYDHVNDLIW